MSEEQRWRPVKSDEYAQPEPEGSGTEGAPQPTAPAPAPSGPPAEYATPPTPQQPGWPPQPSTPEQPSTFRQPWWPAWPPAAPSAGAGPAAAPAGPAAPPSPDATGGAPGWGSYYGSPAPGGWPQMPWQAAPPPRRRRGSIVATGVAFALVLAVGLGVGFGAGRAQPAATTGPQPLQGFDLYNQALNLIEKNYVNRADVTDQTLVYGSIRGLVDALGDTGHSTFLTPDELKAEQQSLNAKLTGIGVIGSDSAGVPSVLRVLPNSPAEKAGMKPGDQIVGVDGVSTSGMTFSDAAKKIRGAAGTKVTLSVLHAGASAPVDLTLTRAEVNVPLVDWSMVPGTKVADILLLQFGSGAADEMKAAIADATKHGATAIVLDLRGNPGGYVGEAVNVASQFLSSGTVYKEKSADGTVKDVTVNKDQPHTKLPLTVLVDHDSASASEIVSGALQANKRGKIVGVKTFGTGTVLQTFTLTDGSALMLGIADWLTPTGERIFGNGITPDTTVALPAGAAPTDPFELQTMTAADFAKTQDTQLVAALKTLGE